MEFHGYFIGILVKAWSFRLNTEWPRCWSTRPTSHWKWWVSPSFSKPRPYRIPCQSCQDFGWPETEATFLVGPLRPVEKKGNLETGNRKTTSCHMVPLGSLKGLRVARKKSSVGDSFFSISIVEVMGYAIFGGWELAKSGVTWIFVGGLRGSDANVFVFMTCCWKINPDHQVKKLMKCMIG